MSLKGNLRSIVGLAVLIPIVAIGYWLWTNPEGASPLSGRYCADDARIGWQLDFAKGKATIIFGDRLGKSAPLELTADGYVIRDPIGRGDVDITMAGPKSIRMGGSESVLTMGACDAR